MNKRFIPIISAFMTISLFVFISVQIFWLREAIRAGDMNFSSRVEEALKNTADKINTQEINKFYNQFNDFYQNIKAKEDSSTLQTAISVIDSPAVRYVMYKRTLVRKTPILIPYTTKDTLKITNLISDEGVLKIKKDPSDKTIQPLNTELERDINSSKFTLYEFARLNINQIPIDKRLTVDEIHSILETELMKLNVDIEFIVGVLDSSFELTNVVGKDFLYSKKNSYSKPLFTDAENNNNVKYYVSVYFPNKRLSVLNPIFGPISITIVSALIIIAIYIVSVYYMYNQKRIADVKTDFINNMSHEFKTPIATINIATDALNSSKVQVEPQKINFYASLIKQENARMSKQIEMVLKMSKLERNEIKLEKKDVNLDSLLDDCIKSIKLQVEERQGTITKEYLSKVDKIDIDPFYFSTVIINILDNANKYSPEKPEINLKVYDQKNSVVIEISDKGKGMKKEVLIKIFEKFYREESGNIHNVKGHGLGLAYVKKIITLHKGIIEVKSKVNKGTQFIVKIPIKPN